MTERTVFNFFNKYKTTIALCKYFKLPQKNGQRYFTEHYPTDEITDNRIYLDFIRDFNISINEFDTANAFITAKHITTFIDNGLSIKKYGLLNLKDVLELETPFKQFLEINGIAFDIHNKKIMLNENCIELFRCNDIRPSKYNKAINKLHIKLYHDKCETEVFLYGEDSEIGNYPSISQYPEILQDIDNLLIALQQPLNLANKWAQLQNGRYYILEFDIPITALEHVNEKPDSYDECEEFFDLFGYTPFQFYSNLIPKRFYSNIFLIKNSIDVFFSRKGKSYGQIFPETVIPYNDLRILEQQIN
jgi:hypothetical protein